jgi:hypothetical protein
MTSCAKMLPRCAVERRSAQGPTFLLATRLARTTRCGMREKGLPGRRLRPKPLSRGQMIARPLPAAMARGLCASENGACRLQQRAYIARAASLGGKVNSATRKWMTFFPCRLAD